MERRRPRENPGVLLALPWRAPFAALGKLCTAGNLGKRVVSRRNKEGDFTTEIKELTEKESGKGRIVLESRVHTIW